MLLEVKKTAGNLVGWAKLMHGCFKVISWNREGQICRLLITATAAYLLPSWSLFNQSLSCVKMVHIHTHTHQGKWQHILLFCPGPGCGDLWTALRILQRPFVEVSGTCDSQSWHVRSAGTFESMNSKPNLPDDRSEVVEFFPIVCLHCSPSHLPTSMSLSPSLPGLDSDPGRGFW